MSDNRMDEILDDVAASADLTNMVLAGKITPVDTPMTTGCLHMTQSLRDHLNLNGLVSKRLRGILTLRVCYTSPVGSTRKSCDRW